jgi:TolA-binding protein
MQTRLLLTHILLLLPSAVQGQAVAAWATEEQQGQAALAAGLWEIAEQHFQGGLAQTGLPAAVKSQLAIRLAESLIRQGSFGEALDLLGRSFVSGDQEAPFWKAQALVGQRHFTEAAGIFGKLLASPEPPHRTECGLTLASLQLGLGQTEAALATLEALLTTADPAARVKIQLYQVEILLDLKNPEAARRALPLTAAVTARDLPLLAFYEAQLQLAEGTPSTAEAGFQELVSHPQGQSLQNFHLAAVGLADAMLAQGKTEAAVKSLLAFIRDYPDSPLLAEMFARILRGLPEKTALTDPVLEQLAQWIPPAVLPAASPLTSIPDGSSAVISPAWPPSAEATVSEDLVAFSLYIRAVGMHRIGTPESRNESHRLLRRLRVEYPSHLLASQALYQAARQLREEGAMEAALALLDTLRITAKFSPLQGDAAYLLARQAWIKGDLKQATLLFDEAAVHLAAPAARSARLYAAIARLRGGGPSSTTLIQQQQSPPDKDFEADLELERALSATPASAARPLLKDFLDRFPDHRRASEARLAAAAAALGSTPPDLLAANTQLDALATAPEDFALRIALLRLRIVDRGADPAATIALAQSIIDAHPGDPAAGEAALTLGRNLFQTGSYNSARLTLEALAFSDPDPVQAQTAWLLAARSAALGGTPQSKDEALKIFDKAIAAKGLLTAIATLEKAEHLTDLYRFSEATAFLGKWIETLAEDDPLQLPAGLLLGEALYAQGSDYPGSLVDALATYDKLLRHAKNQPALMNRLQYLRGITLERLPEGKDPAKKREKQAFQAFYSVLETTTPPQEWEYFERCGFRALALLEKSGRWPVAVNVAKKIASFKGPRAEEAAARATKLQLTHMIYEDN